MRRFQKRVINGVTYKSGWEASVAQELHHRGISFTYEEHKVVYWTKEAGASCRSCGSRDVHKRRTYNPDFYIPSRGLYIEAKGKFTGSERKKHMSLKEQHPDLDIRMLFQYDNWVTDKQLQKYSDWCEKKGIEYHVGLPLPDSWFE